MTWTHDDEEDFQRRLEEHREYEAKLDSDKEAMVRMGMLPACPSRGSHRYIAGVKAEVCEDCGYGQSYW